MQIVIDIPEDHKRVIDNLVADGKGYLLPGVVEDTLAKAVKQGVPLSEGHGRLIDADMLPICHGVFLPRVNGNTLGCPADAVFVSDIEDTPTIIEADKE